MRLNSHGTRSPIERNTRNSSVIGNSSALHRLIYTPYGYHVSANTGKGQCKFNGEMQDDLSGNYFLGNGHRIYSPIQMRFISYDQLSPFGRGGLNGYAYCSNDPINFTDPTGRVRFQRTPEPATRSTSWIRTQSNRIYNSLTSVASRMRGRRSYPSPFEQTTSSYDTGYLPEYSSTNPPPEYTATLLPGQQTITSPYTTKLRPTPEQAERLRSYLETLQAKENVIKDRINNPGLIAQREINEKLLLKNETRIIAIHSLIGLTLPPTYFEAQRFRQS